jgi:LysM repeat protein
VFALIYIVSEGDTLQKIASKHNVSIKDIMDSNPVIAHPDWIQVNQRLSIPEKSSLPKSMGENRIPSDDQVSHSNDKELGDTVAHCKLKEEPKKKIGKITIRVSVFFDGTANNRTNTEQREHNTRTYLDQGGPDGSGSYENDYTNISKLEKLILSDAQAEHFLHVYIEGAGTQDNDSDKLKGLVRGMGDTGVIVKVEKGIEKVITLIERLHLDKIIIIETVYLDAFGFSRGAAAARHFIHAALERSDTNVKKILESKGYTVSAVKIKFIGLYDTVASYGFNHDKDTSELHLDAISSAEKVVQLAAADEHRENFRLTNIKSAKEKGKQIFLPGVHSDIGGGYRDNSEEKDYQILDIDTVWAGDETKKRFEKERDWLISSGWYTAEEIKDTNFWNELKVNRTGIRNTYNRIPLQIMADFAADTGLSFTDLSRDFSIPDELEHIKKLIDEHIATGISTYKYWWDMNYEWWWDEDSKEMKNLRHNFLHFSSSYGDIMGSMHPQFKNNQRERIIQNG